MDSALSFLEDIIHKPTAAISNRDFYVGRFVLSMVDLLSFSIVTFFLKRFMDDNSQYNVACGFYLV